MGPTRNNVFSVFNMAMREERVSMAVGGRIKTGGSPWRADLPPAPSDCFPKFYVKEWSSGRSGLVTTPQVLGQVIRKGTECRNGRALLNETPQTFYLHKSCGEEKGPSAEDRRLFPGPLNSAMSAWGGRGRQGTSFTHDLHPDPLLAVW